MALNKYRESVDGALAGLYASTRRGAAQDVSYRWLQIHAWMEQGAKLLQMPEYMGTVPPQAGGKSLLSDFWREHANLLTWKRYEKTREAMVEAMRREAGGEETKPSTDATRSMCQRWFRAVKDAVKDAAISTLDLDPLTAGPKLESPAPPPPTPRAAPGCGEAGSSAR